MAFVKVTPFYEEGNPMPKFLRYNELLHRKQKEEHKEEKEKLLSVGEQNVKQAEQHAKEHKHLTQVKDPKFHRMALKK